MTETKSTGATGKPEKRQGFHDTAAMSKKKKILVLNCFLVSALLLLFSSCMHTAGINRTVYSLDDLSIDTDFAKEDSLSSYNGYKGKIIKLSPINGSNWDDWSKPVYWDLNNYSDFYNITISMSVLVEPASTRIFNEAPLLKNSSEIDINYNPNIGCTIYNGSRFSRFGGSAIEVPCGQWTDIVFSQIVYLSKNGDRKVFIDGVNEHQGLVDLSLYIRHFKVTMEKINGGKYLALTFDDGPSDLTDTLLDKLDELGVKATFFLLGMGIDALNPRFDKGLTRIGREEKIPERRALVRRMFYDGHDVASHSYSHNYLGGGKLDGNDTIDPDQQIEEIPILENYSVTVYPLNEEDIRKELEDTQIAIQKAIYGDYDYLNHPWVSKYFRTPFSSDETKATILLDTVKTIGLPIIYGLGSDDYLPQLSPEEIAETIHGNLLPWGISINHDPSTAPQILDVLDIIVPLLKAEGFEFATISEMERKRGKDLTPGNVYYNLWIDAPEY